MKRIRFFAALALLFAMSVSGEDVLGVGARKKMAIVQVRKSGFKDAVVEGIMNKYKDRLKVDKMGKCRSRELEDYDVILLVDALQAWTWFNGRTKKYIRKTEDKGKIILFFSLEDEKLKPSYRGIDAVTSASKDENKADIIKKLSGRIDEILEKE